jgi:hypothetical protein
VVLATDPQGAEHGIAKGVVGFLRFEHGGFVVEDLVAAFGEVGGHQVQVVAFPAVDGPPGRTHELAACESGGECEVFHVDGGVVESRGRCARWPRPGAGAGRTSSRRRPGAGASRSCSSGPRWRRPARRQCHGASRRLKPPATPPDPTSSTTTEHPRPSRIALRPGLCASVHDDSATCVSSVDGRHRRAGHASGPRGRESSARTGGSLANTRVALYRFARHRPGCVRPIRCSDLFQVLIQESNLSAPPGLDSTRWTDRGTRRRSADCNALAGRFGPALGAVCRWTPRSAAVSGGHRNGLVERH